MKGYDNQTSFAKTLPVAIGRTFGPQALDTVLDIWPSLRHLLPFQPPVRRIINEITGSVKEGEMLLVLGKVSRPVLPQILDSAFGTPRHKSESFHGRF